MLVRPACNVLFISMNLCLLFGAGAGFVITPLQVGQQMPLSLHSTVKSSTGTSIGQHIAIDENFNGVTKINSNPDIFIIHDFLSKEYCTDLIEKAKAKKLDQSPVAYAGKMDDVKDLLSLAAKGPVAWFAILSAWFQVSGDDSTDQVQLLIHALQNYAVLFALAAAGIFAFIESKADGLQALRTSTSTTLDDLDEMGTFQFVKRSADLFNPMEEKRNPAKQAMYFEAPTVIRYEAGQVLQPHFDANRSAETEDANRGGQTLATLILYLNDVEKGGLTRFGLIKTSDDTKLTVEPKAGDALLFFPADEEGSFDDRLEHEGCPAVDEKWIARIWRHIDRVPPPFGLSNAELSKL